MPMGDSTKDAVENCESPDFSPAFIAPAKREGFIGAVQALEPDWLYVKQLEDPFRIRGSAADLAMVLTEPIPIPPQIASSIRNDVMGGSKEAEQHLREAEKLSHEFGDKKLMADCSRISAEVHLAMGDHERAEKEAKQALEISEKLDLKPEMGLSLRVLAEVTAAFLVLLRTPPLAAL